MGDVPEARLLGPCQADRGVLERLLGPVDRGHPPGGEQAGVGRLEGSPRALGVGHQLVAGGHRVHGVAHKSVRHDQVDPPRHTEVLGCERQRCRIGYGLRRPRELEASEHRLEVGAREQGRVGDRDVAGDQAGRGVGGMAEQFVRQFPTRLQVATGHHRRPQRPPQRDEL